MKIHRAYRTELAPDDSQLPVLYQHAGTARFAYNWGLEHKLEAIALNRRLAEDRTLSGCDDPEVNAALDNMPEIRFRVPTAIDLHRELNALKATRFPWMYESSKCAPQEALRDLDTAFRNFFESRARFPAPKSRKHGVGSFTLTGLIVVRPNKVQFPRLGWVRLKENGYLPSSAHINSATVSERAGRWFVSINVVEDVPDPAPVPGPVVGVDCGLKSMAVVSDGTVVKNPKALFRHERKLKHLHRAVSRKQRGSKNRRRAVQALARLQMHITNVRKDAINKATTELARTKPVIVVETLNVDGMMKNHCLARSIADAGWSEFVRQLEYKTKWNGSRLVKTDPFFPSSQLCSVCGRRHPGMKDLGERELRCECGLVMDRDLNAAVNLSRWPRVAGTPETPVEGGVQPMATPAQPFCEAGTISLEGCPKSWTS